VRIGGRDAGSAAHCALRNCPRDAGSGGKYTGRNTATRPLSVRIEYGQPTRSAITVAGIVGNAFNNSRIRGSNPSTTDPTGRRQYLGGPSLANAAFTVFLATPSTRAISEIAIPSDRRNRRISAQSSTSNTCSLPPAPSSQGLQEAGQLSVAARWSVFICRRHRSLRMRSSEVREPLGVSGQGEAPVGQVDVFEREEPDLCEARGVEGAA